MIRTGTTRFWDMYWHPEATARAVTDSGLNATVGAPLFDHDGDAGGMRERALASLDHLAGLGPAIAPALAPHSIYTVSEASLRWIAELGAERRLPIQIHLAETEREASDCVAAHGLRPAAYLDSVGILCERTVLAHGVWLDEEELELIAARGCTVVTNPVANMKLAVGGVFPYPAARAAGIAVGLGTRRCRLERLARPAQRPEALRPGPEACCRRSDHDRRRRGLGRGDRGPGAALGAGEPLAVGAAADFLLLCPDSPELSIGELASDLVYAASGSVVDTTVVGGRVLMRGGALAGRDEIVARAGERARRLGL